MAAKKFSEITPLGTKPALTDQLVAVIGGNQDRLVKVSDVGGRTVLAADANYYVSASGNDSNDGSVSHPWATVQHAGNFIAENIDIAGFQVFVNIGAGTFAGIQHPSYFGGGTVQFNGAGSGSTTLTAVPPSTGSPAFISWACFGDTNPQSTTPSINKVTLDSSNFGDGASGITTYGLAFIGAGDATSNFDFMDLVFNIGNRNFAITTGGFGSAVYISPNGNERPDGSVTFQSSIADPFGMIFSEFGSSVILSCTPTVSGTPAWASAGISVDSGASVTVNAIPSWTGTATGFRYTCTAGGYIDDNFNGYRFFPGDVQGTVSDGTAGYGKDRVLRMLPANPSGTQTFNSTPGFVFPFNNTVAITILIKAMDPNGTPFPDPVNIFAGNIAPLRFVNVGTGGVTFKGDTGVTLNGVLTGTVSMGGQYTGMIAWPIAQDNWWFIPGMSL